MLISKVLYFLKKFLTIIKLIDNKGHKKNNLKIFLKKLLKKKILHFHFKNMNRVAQKSLK